MDYEIKQSAYYKGTVYLLSLVNDNEGVNLMWTNHKLDLQPGQKVPLQALRDMFQADHNRQVRQFIKQSNKNRPKQPRGSQKIMDITKQQINSGMFK